VLVGVIALDDGELAVLGVLEVDRQVLEQRRDRAPPSEQVNSVPSPS